jgi:acyl-CoA synthetase (AMP-forming)/AMP-acid ligase II
MLEQGLSHWLPDAGAEPALRDITVADLLDEAVERRPDAEAIVYSAYDEPELTLRLTYTELRERVIEVAAALIGSGLEPGDKAVVWATNIPHHPLLQFGCAYANVTMLPINPLYRRDELSYVLGKTDPDAIFLLPQDRRASLWNILADSDEGAPSLRLRVALGEAPDDSGIGWAQWLRSAGEGVTREQVLARRATVKPSDLSQIQFTSGTTGFPKGVELTNWILANQGIQMGAVAGFEDYDKIVNPMPLFHCGGCVLATLGALSVAATHMPIVTFDPRPICQTVEAEQATVLVGVPTMLLAVQDEAERTGRSLESVRTVVSGGSVVPPRLGQGWQERLGVDFVITYGQTEHGPLATCTSPPDPKERQITTVGRPIPHVELDVVVPGTNQRLPVGAEGELRYRGYVMNGYYEDPEATARAVDEEGWLYSGDLGRIDEDGYVQITGRAKEMIIRGGENIAPASVEEGVRGLEQVADVCVVGVPDEAMGEELCAFVRLNEGHTLTATEMRELLLDRIARYKIPRYLGVLEDFPLTPSGKIQRFRLREIYNTSDVVQDSRAAVTGGSAAGRTPGAKTP